MAYIGKVHLLENNCCAWINNKRTIKKKCLKIKYYVSYIVVYRSSLERKRTNFSLHVGVYTIVDSVLTFNFIFMGVPFLRIPRSRL